MDKFEIIATILNILLLSAAAAFDIKKTEVPLTISFLLLILNAVYSVTAIIKGESPLSLLITLALLLVLTIPFAVKGGLGGADVLIEFGLALTLRFRILYLILFANLFCLPQSVKAQKTGKEYPFVPYILGSYILTLILGELWHLP